MHGILHIMTNLSLELSSLYKVPMSAIHCPRLYIYIYIYTYIPMYVHTNDGIAIQCRFL